MKEMSLEDEQRIAKEAADCYSVEFNPVCWMVKREGYIAGATRENERMAELLKEEKNKTIDGVIRKLDSEYVERGDIVAPWKNIKHDIESLKSQ